jgi:hypothetical protein
MAGVARAAPLGASLVCHVVLLKFGPAFEAGDMVQAEREIGALLGIPGVRCVAFAATGGSAASRGPYTHCVVGLLESPDALKAYGPHPLHQAWVGKWVKTHQQADTPVLALDSFSAVFLGAAAPPGASRAFVQFTAFASGGAMSEASCAALLASSQGPLAACQGCYAAASGTSFTRDRSRDCDWLACALYRSSSACRAAGAAGALGLGPYVSKSSARYVVETEALLHWGSGSSP